MKESNRQSRDLPKRCEVLSVEGFSDQCVLIVESLETESRILHSFSCGTGKKGHEDELTPVQLFDLRTLALRRN
jgi:hypothetical protein